MSGGSGDGLSASSSGGARAFNVRVVPPPDKNGVEKHHYKRWRKGQGELSPRFAETT